MQLDRQQFLTALMTVGLLAAPACAKKDQAEPLTEEGASESSGGEAGDDDGSAEQAPDDSESPDGPVAE